jgi:hypothetical protein
MRALLATTAALAVMLSWYFVKEDEPAYEVAHRNVIRQCDHLVAEADSANKALDLGYQSGLLEGARHRCYQENGLTPEMLEDFRQYEQSRSR